MFLFDLDLSSFSYYLDHSFEYEESSQTVVGKLIESVEFWERELKASPL